MKLEQFRTTLDAFLQGPQPYRNLYVWYGEDDGLMALLPAGRTQSLNLFQLAAELNRHPFAQDEANELLRDALRARLRGWYSADTHPILIVTGCELLARYRVGLQPFYSVLTDRSMVILICSALDAAYDPAGRLPGYVQCEPGTTLAYLSRLVEDDHVVETG
jgi:hypothetical protein